MRYLFLPEELTVLQLLPLDTLAVEPRAEMEAVLEQIIRGEMEEALERLSRQQEKAWGQRRRYLFALNGLYRAELLRRQCRWEMALQEMERVLPWLSTRSDTDARYDEAVALYLQGLIYYRLHTDDKAQDCFLTAIAHIRRCMEDWSYRLEDEKLELGRRLVHWMERLLEAQPQTPPLARKAIVPLYIPPPPVLRFDLLILPLYEGEGKQGQTTMYCRPVDAHERLLCCPLCGRFYFALPVSPEGLPALSDSKPDDLIVMTSERPLRLEEVFALRSFRRYPDGEIVWEDESMPRVKLSGIPAALCRVDHPSPP